MTSKQSCRDHIMALTGLWYEDGFKLDHMSKI